MPRRVPAFTATSRARLEAILASGAPRAQLTRRALILLEMAKGAPTKKVAAKLHASFNTVCLLRKRFFAGGIEEALQIGVKRRPGPGRPRVFGAAAENRLKALAASQPPEGSGYWTLRTLAAKAVEIGLVESVSYGTVGNILRRAGGGPPL